MLSKEDRAEAAKRVRCYYICGDERNHTDQMLEYVIGFEGHTWAVRRRGGWCLDKHGEWEYEPIPSSRDNAFLKRCRFSLADAVKLICAHLDPTFPNLEET